MLTSVLIFGVVFIFAIALFAWSCYMRFRLIGLGTPENRFKNVVKRLWSVISLAIIQRCTLSGRYKFGINHFILFWCFMILLIANTEFLFHGLFPNTVALSKLPTGLYYTLALIFDIVSIGALLAVIAAVSRRLLFPPKYIDARTPDAFTILSLIALLMIAFFGLHGSEIAMGKEAAAAFMPISSSVGSWMAGVPKNALETMSVSFWWLHAAVLLAFLNYLPYSKHMHILTSLPNCYFRSLEKVTTQPREEFKSGNIFGVSQIDQFRWKDLFDSYSCTECGRCNNNCPATNTDKPLNPRLVIHNMKINLLHNGPGLLKKQSGNMPLIGSGGEGSVEEDAIWACTTCGACMEVCPVRIEHVPKLVYMRRSLVETKSKFPEELLNLFENMEQRSNPWGIAPADRVKWAAEANAKPFENGKTEYLFYVGCFGAYDSRSKQSTVALAKVLGAAGISWGILGKDELCCGDSLRRLGNEYVFDQMAKANIAVLNNHGVKKIITQCPHCYNTLKNDYKQYGAEFEMIHHSELINDLIKEKKLNFSGATDLGTVAFHDSCYLGRYNGIYEQPRAAVKAVTGKVPAEMGNNHSYSFCCGAGGGRMWMEESIGTRINLTRVRETLKLDPKTVCVCCPYCMAMFEDGLKDEKASDRVKVMELSEIIAQSLK